jgi:hypothetical protein
MSRPPSGYVRHALTKLGASFGAALLAVTLLSPAHAAPPAAAADPEGTVVQELVVTAKAGGPAWWRVSSGAGTVYILGTVDALPKGQAWDTALLRRRLAGANVFIGPPEVTAGLGDIFALLSLRRHFRSRAPVEDTLPADLRARFLADRPRLSRDPHAYSHWTSLAAGLVMVDDFRKQAHLARDEPVGTITRLARAQGVKVTAAGRYKAVPLLRAAEAGLAAAGPACMADSLDEIEAGPARIRIAAEGWTRGDVAAALSAQRGYEKCLASLPEGADVVTTAMADTTTAISAALARPGHGVAAVNLRLLLAQGGVLQRLRAKGYTVTTPEG